MACSCVDGKRRRHRPLLRVSTTKLRASGRKETRHFDCDKEGGRASNTDSLDCVGDGAVGGRFPWE